MYNTDVPLTNLALNAFVRYLFICLNVSFYRTVIHKKSMVLTLGQSKNISAHNTIYIYIYIYIYIKFTNERFFEVAIES